MPHVQPFILKMPRVRSRNREASAKQKSARVHTAGVQVARAVVCAESACVIKFREEIFCANRREPTARQNSHALARGTPPFVEFRCERVPGVLSLYRHAMFVARRAQRARFRPFFFDPPFRYAITLCAMPAVHSSLSFRSFCRLTFFLLGSAPDHRRSRRRAPHRYFT